MFFLSNVHKSIVLILINWFVLYILLLVYNLFLFVLLKYNSQRVNIFWNIYDIYNKFVCQTVYIKINFLSIY